MNDNHSHHEWKYIPRWITGNFQSALEAHPVVVLTGARQVGKSTFLQNASPTNGWSQMTMDDLDILAQARQNPASLISGKVNLVLDEIQKAPLLLSEIKKYIDNSKRSVRLVLSGSANLLLLKRVSESLAGRAVFFTLDSMAYREQNQNSPGRILKNLFNLKWPEEKTVSEKSDLSSILLRGLIPPVLSFQQLSSVVQWWEGYVTTFLERDLHTLSRLNSLPDFRRLMTALALRSGNLLNQTEVSRSLAIPQPTIHRYLNLLEVMCVLFRLPAFSLNRSKRLVKTPKLYWFDVGLASFLAGYHDVDSILHARELGGLLETLIFQHLRIWSNLQIPKAKLYYWRTTTGKEVDFVLETRNRLIAIEVKASGKAQYGDIKNLRLFLDEYPDLAKAGILVYAGSEIKRMDRDIIAVPWHVLV